MFDQVESIFAHLSTHDEFDSLIHLCDSRQKGKCWKDVDPDKAAHHGIIPTSQKADTSIFSEDEALVYNLIAKRFLQQFMEPRKLNQKSVVVSIGELNFKLSATEEIKPGWRVKGSSNELDVYIPNLNVGDAVICVSGETATKTTKKPARFTEATLLKEMGNAFKYINDPNLKRILKEAGLGTEATQADILSEQIAKKTIVVKKGKIHIPDEVEKFLDFIPDEIKSVDTTALWEEMLKLVENNELSLNDFMNEITSYLKETVERYK